ncbi:hypothetical protein ABS767_14005 [Sphingomonas sp. ST-64]|uniref:Lipoprotein n=1 Tax=Sphingomonas plantiphila TaxID=3163295 RepID=A0ABW8YP57_9SPHN
MLLSLTGCFEPQTPAFDSIELRAPGLEVAIDGKGKGTFTRSNFHNRQFDRGKFSLSNERYDLLVERLEQFRRSDETVNESEAAALLERTCRGEDVTDQGGVTIHWRGSYGGQWYLADFGCEPKRYAERNRELRAVLASLPVPKVVPLP